MNLSKITVEANSPDALLEKRTQIRDGMERHNEAFLRRSPRHVHESDIRHMMRLYDRCFFGNELCRRVEGRITYRFSTRMTRTAGKVAYNRRDKTFVLSLSLPLIVRSFEKEEAAYDVNGMTCASALEAMMCVLEHELVHLLEFELWGRSSCAKPRFKGIAARLFGHTGTKHSLGVPEQNRRDAMLLPLGSTVRFTHGGRSYTGILKRITKRATVVLDPAHGGRYEKFYVPLDRLSVVAESD